MSKYLYTFTKYRFKGLPLLVLSDDNKFYRLAYENNGRFYGLKELKVHYHQGQNKLLYNGKRWVKSKLMKLKYSHNELIKKDRQQFHTPDNFKESELSKILNTF